MLNFAPVYYKKGKACKHHVKQKEHFCENTLKTLGFNKIFAETVCTSGANVRGSLKTLQFLNFL
jgi:hypothetical protein